MKRSLHAFLLAFALLFAQAGAAVHAAGHVAAAGGGDKGLPTDSACELCVSYAQLSDAAPPSAPPVLPLCVARHEAPSMVTAAVATRTVLHSRARAPPVLS